MDFYEPPSAYLWMILLLTNILKIHMLVLLFNNRYCLKVTEKSDKYLIVPKNIMEKFVCMKQNTIFDANVFINIVFIV